MTALIETSSDRWTRMIRSTGVVGLVTFVVLFAAIIAMSPGEPPFLASPEEALAFYLNTTAGWVQAAMAVTGSGSDRLDLVRGGIVPAARPGRGESAMAVRGRSGVRGNPRERSCYSIPAGTPPRSVPPTSIWQLPATPSMSAVSGLPTSGSPWAVLRRAPAGWCCPLASSVVGLAGGRSPAGWGSCSPDSSGHRWFWFLPYAAFWIWMIIMCIQLVRKPRAVLKAADGRASPGGERP